MNIYMWVGIVLLVLSVSLVVVDHPKTLADWKIFVFQLCVALLFLVAGIYLGGVK